MYQQFIDRQRELEFLEKAYHSEKPSLIIISGRRRVGKSELVLQFVKNKKSLYFLCSTEGDRENIKEFQKKLAGILEDESFAEIKFANWFNLFSTLVKNKEFSKITKKKLILIFDEFPFLIMSNPAIPSVFQKIWEELLKKENVMLILTGSSISVMERKVLSQKSPLYGRRAGSFILNPLNFIFLRDFLPDYRFKDLFKIWFVVGGIPEYVLKFNPKLDFWKNTKENVIKKGCYLYEEAEILLKDEFKEPRNYKLILKAISYGYQTAGKICGFTGLDKSMVSKYLDVLKEVKIIREFIPVTESRRFKGRLYKIIDPYFNFWFRFVYPNKIDLEAHQEKEVLERIKVEFKNYAGKMFEYLIEELIRKKFLFKNIIFTQLGKQWGKFKGEKGKNTYEIDIVTLNAKTKEALFAECKWKDKVNAEKTIKELSDKAKYVHWRNNERKESYAIFAKSFNKKIKEFEGKKVYCFDLKDIKKILK